MKRQTVLNFTHEEFQETNVHFLDISFKIADDGSCHTSVYIKPTDNGIYSNFNSYTLDRYKRSVVKTLVHRAIKYSSSWKAFDSEIKRIRQTLVNNDYPLYIVDSIIKTQLDNKINPKEAQEDVCKQVKFYVNLDNLTSFKNDRRCLNMILKEHVKPIDADTTVRLCGYFKPFKMESCFSTRSKPDTLKTARCVYQYDCYEDSCRATYVGYTSCLLEVRAKQHRREASAICKHLRLDHNVPMLPINSFLSNFKVLHKCNDIIRLRLAEAILIRRLNPLLNIKYNEMSNFLNLYK